MTAAVEAPPGLCGCGCGQPTPIAAKTDRRTGTVRGQPMRYVHGHNARPALRLANGHRRPRSGVCACGCGQRTAVVRGRPNRWVHNHHMNGVASVEPLTAAEAYAVELLGRAEQLVAALRDDLTEFHGLYRAALAVEPPPGVDPYEALVTVLAAQVDPEAPRSRRVGWADG